MLWDREQRCCNAAEVLVEVEMKLRSDIDMPITTRGYTLQHRGCKSQPERTADGFCEYGDRTSSFELCPGYVSSVVFQQGQADTLPASISSARSAGWSRGSVSRARSCNKTPEVSPKVYIPPR